VANYFSFEGFFEPGRPPKFTVAELPDEEIIYQRPPIKRKTDTAVG